MNSTEKINQLLSSPAGRYLDLIAVIIFILLTTIFVAVPPLNETALRVVFGFGLVFIIPGYVFVCTLFPDNSEIDTIERIALSMGLSIAITIFTGFALNYTPWGIRLAPILLSLSAITLLFTVTAAGRRLMAGNGEDSA